ncbi:hypothetical protein B0J14DRAFT_565196 [Halenospora varia]|nr:hypothetical protein B0J14DRAFT_565196 [Halenospora varia]
MDSILVQGWLLSSCRNYKAVFTSTVTQAGAVDERTNNANHASNLPRIVVNVVMVHIPLSLNQPAYNVNTCDTPHPPSTPTFPHSGPPTEDIPPSTTTARVRGLEKLVRRNSTAAPPDEETTPSAPNLFMTNPGAYFEDVISLQERNFELGKRAMNIDESWAEFEVLEVRPILEKGSLLHQAQPPPPRTQKLLQSTIEGFKILHEFGLCLSTYNLIIFNARRSNVVGVVPVSSHTLSLMSALFEEAVSPHRNDAQSIIDFADEPLFEVLHDLLELTDSALPGLLDENTFSSSWIATPLNVLFKLSYDLYSAQIVLFLGLVSFVSSHLANVRPQRRCSRKLWIKNEGNDIFLELRELKCLFKFTTQPVWTFSRSSSSTEDESSQIPESHYISIYPADFKDLWGPVALHYYHNSYTNITKIITRGGMIQAARSNSQTIHCRPDEALCHFQSWMDHSSEDSVVQFSSKQWMLIGTPHRYEHYSRATEASNSSDLSMCQCSLSRQTFFSQSFELQTRSSSWKKNERVAQLNAGIVLEIDYCSANSRRTSLWQILRQKDVQRFLIDHLEERGKDFQILLEYFPRTALFRDIWSAITIEGKDIMKRVFQALLEVMRSTGVREDGTLQAWDLTDPGRLDGRTYTSNWTRMVKDDTDCRRVTRESPVKGATLSQNELQLLSVNSVGTKSPRPSWALSSESFERWKVMKSGEAQSSTTPNSFTNVRVRVLDRARDEAASLAHISERIKARQERRNSLPSSARGKIGPVHSESKTANLDMSPCNR